MAHKTFTHKNKEQDPGFCQHVCLVKDKVDAGGMYSSQKNLQLMMTCSISYTIMGLIRSFTAAEQC